MLRDRKSLPVPPTLRPGQAGYSREAVLAGTVFLLLGLFAVTAFASRMYHKTVHVLADQWYSKGEAAFQSGKFPDAVTDYRNALLYSPNNTAFQFRLAQALSLSGHVDQAESYLLNLLSESPGSGPVNLELARIAARRPDGTVDALRYFHGAIYGVWDSDPLNMRWEVRRELCEFLLSHGASRQVEPELIALADNVPLDDITRTKQAAELLLRGQLWNRALAIFQTLCALNGHDSAALAGAGEAAFHLAEYPQTVDFLSKIPAEERSDSQTDMIETSRRVLALDPFHGALSSQSRAAIAARDLALAKSHAESCVKQPSAPTSLNASQPDLGKLIAQSDSMKTAWSERMLARFPDRMNDAMGLAFQMENATVSACGPLSGPDRALWLLGLVRASTSSAPSSAAAGATP